MTIRNKLRLSIGLIVVAIIAVYTAATYLAERHLLLQALDEQLLHAVEHARGDLPADYHDRIVSSTSVSPDEYAGIVDKNNKLCLTLGLQYLWSCMKVGDQVVFTTATSPGKDVAKRDYAPFFSVHSDPHSFDRAFETMKPVFGSFENEWGHGRMLLVPGRDRLGRAYCFGASVSAGKIHAELNHTLLHSLYLGIGFLLIGMLVSFVVSNNLAKPIVRLTEIADGIARGKTGQPIGINGPTEILSLAQSLAAMDGSIRQKIGQLEAEAEKLRLLSGALEAAANAIIITDKEGAILWANSAFTTFTGYSAAEAIGKKPSLLKSGEQDRGFYKKLWKTILNGEVWSGELTNRRKDGSLYPEDMTITPMKDSRGEITHFISVKQDITERKKAQLAIAKANEALEQRVAERTEELERSEEQYRMLFEASRDAIITTDGEGNCLDCNRAAVEMFGCPDKAGLLAMGVRGLSPEFQPDGRSTREAFYEVLSELRDKETLLLEWQHQRADGESFPAEVALSRFYVNGQPVLHGMLRDISQRKEAERKLREAKDLAESASRAKGTFLANMSHEIRTPMNAILGFSQLLLHDPDLAAGQRKHLETIGRSGEHLLALINSILDMSKIEAGRVELKPVPCDLSALLRDLEAMFRLRTDTKGLSLDIVLGDDLPPYCVADKGKLLQVLINLLGNAVKFTGKGGIVLRASLEAAVPPRLLFEVEDTGIGIPEELIEKLFQPFVQVHGENQPGSGLGTGLGLAISREIAGLMGGDITVTSKVGKGSTFRFSIPLVKGEMERENGGSVSPRAAEPRPALPEELASLPADLVAQIRNAAVTADYDRLMELIETVDNKNLSLVLSVLVKRYNYQRLLDLLDSAQQQSTS